MRDAKASDAGSALEGAAGHVVLLEPLCISMETMMRIIDCGKTRAFQLTDPVKGEIEVIFDGRRRKPIYESVKRYVARLRDQQKLRVA